MRPDIDLRGYLDTRLTTITLIISGLAVLGAALLGGLVQPFVFEGEIADISLTTFVLTLPLSLIIPVIAVVVTAGEWSDRSIQVTLLQRPGRLGVLASKVIAATAVVATVVAISLALGFLTTWFAGEVLGERAVFENLGSMLAVQLSVLAATFLFALAMGVVTQSTVLGLIAAIGVPFVISTAAVIVQLTGSAVIADVVRAVDLQTAATQIGNGDGEAFDAIPYLLLVVLPLALGAWRWRTREVG